ncbi:hypothetical protein GCM10010840_11310 [Deinococcus aerolatus]|uniref:Uncharacterized protein n=1 Tax=Deinococcus aerolatus TaxID=522487 RepID=A0ABQ2G4Q8_9DEIO|nr:hypothetical protein GCM10010840_11310 [Deinococcus aerolatus]
MLRQTDHRVGGFQPKALSHPPARLRTTNTQVRWEQKHLTACGKWFPLGTIQPASAVSWIFILGFNRQKFKK